MKKKLFLISLIFIFIICRTSFSFDRSCEWGSCELKKMKTIQMIKNSDIEVQERKIQIFENSSLSWLEFFVNNWIKQNPNIKIIDIQYPYKIWGYSCIIIYKENKKIKTTSIRKNPNINKSSDCKRIMTGIGVFGIFILIIRFFINNYDHSKH